MHLRKSSFQFILFQLKDHVVLYSGYTDYDYKTMVFYMYSAPLLWLREGLFRIEALVLCSGKTGIEN